MFASFTCLLLIFIELSTATKIYLHPPLNDVDLKSQRTQPRQARLLLSHHLRLEQFDNLYDSDKLLPNIFQPTNFVGEGLGNAFILNVDSRVAQGE